MNRWCYVVVAVVGVLVCLVPGCGSDKTENPVNTAPTASFIVTPGAGTTQTAFQFDASSSSDAEDPTPSLEVRWDWENDGAWDTDWATTKTANHQYGTAGTKTIALEVKDTDGLTDHTTRTVTVSVANTPPTASFTVDPAAGHTSTVFAFDASTSSDLEDPLASLRFRWDWEDDGTFDTDWLSAPDATHQFSQNRTYTVRLEVRDSGALVGTTTHEVQVTPGNTSPVACFTVDPSSGTTSTVFQFDASCTQDAEDPDASLQFDWDWEGDGTYDVQRAGNWTEPHTFAASDTYNVVLRVVDTGSASDKDTVQVIVSAANTAPAASFTVTPTVGTVDTVFRFDASGSSDAEDPVSALQVRWDWENDGTWDTDWSATKTASHQYPTVGTKTIRLRVKDTGDSTDDTTRTVTVTGGVDIGEMVLVPAGTFEMGDGAAFCGSNEHQVTLTHSFYLGKYEVTNKEYRDALQWAYDQNPTLVSVSGSAVYDNLDGSTASLVDLASSYCQISFSEGVFTVDAGTENYPMVDVSWDGAAAYCDWLSLQAGLAKAYNHSTWECNNGDPYTAAGYRLPTDAEWEYATQYGGERIYPWGNESPDCSRANFYGADYCVGATAAVGSCELGKSDLGLYDMAGNVWEWCNDWHTCTTTEAEDPKGPTSGSYRVLRGGSWRNNASGLRCAIRTTNFYPSNSIDCSGFRCARSQ